MSPGMEKFAAKYMLENGLIKIRLREAGIAYDFLSEPIDLDPVSGQKRNLVPWMALVVFDPEELLISTTDATAIGLMTINNNVTTYNVSSYDPTKLPANGAFQMTIGDYLSKISNHRIYYEAGYVGAPTDLAALQASTDMTNVIFPTKALIKTLFGAKTTPSVGGSDQVFEGQKVLAFHLYPFSTGSSLTVES